MKSFFKRNLSAKVPFDVLLNGVDGLNFNVTPEKKVSSQAKKLIFLFVGKLEKDKGAHYFIEAFRQVHLKGKNFLAYIVGEGTQFEALKKTIAQNQLESKILLEGGKPQKELERFYRQADVYVSVNWYGNLSNTVLEALRASKPLVLYKSCKKTLRDFDTEELFGDIPFYIDREEPVQSLAKILLSLVEHPEQIEEKEKRIALLAKEKLMSWQDRINLEVALLEKIALS